MSDNGDQKTFVNQYRRKTLLSGVAFLAVNLAASPSLACGGGGECGSCEEQSSTTKKEPNAKNKKQSLVMSQAKFLRLSPAEIRKLKSNNGPKYDLSRKYYITITGFSFDMTEILLDMANSERKLTHKLLKDMAKLKTFKTRKEHLRRERYRVTKLMKELKKEKDNLPKTTAPQTEKLLGKLFNKKSKADEIDARIQSLTYYLGGAGHGVGGWSQSPMEGTLK